MLLLHKILLLEIQNLKTSKDFSEVLRFRGFEFLINYDFLCIDAVSVYQANDISCLVEFAYVDSVVACHVVVIDYASHHVDDLYCSLGIDDEFAA